MTESAGSSAAPRVQDVDLVIHNGCVITMDPQRRVLQPGAVAIGARRIVAVGTDSEILECFPRARRLDARGAAVHPGFIDAHLHVVHLSARGALTRSSTAASPAVNFADWKAGVTSEDEFVATQLACLELLRNGFTAYVEPGTVFDNDAAAAATESAGMRALLSGCYVWDRTETIGQFKVLESQALYARARPDLQRAVDALGTELHRNRDPDALVRGFVSVYGLGSASDELLRAAKALADEHDVAFQQHEGYVPPMTAADRQALGRARIVHLAEMGLLDARCALVHMSVLDADEIAAVRAAAASLVWCPIAYFKLGISETVHPPIPALHRAGVAVALGTDGAADCSVADTGLAALFAAQGAGEPVDSADILEMRTIGAARAAGIAGFTGSLEVGKRADIVVHAAAGRGSWRGADPVHHAAVLTRAEDVDTVLVDGQVLIRHGRSTRLDEAEVHQRARLSVAARMQRLGLGEPR